MQIEGKFITPYLEVATCVEDDFHLRLYQYKFGLTGDGPSTRYMAEILSYDDARTLANFILNNIPRDL